MDFTDRDDTRAELAAAAARLIAEDGLDYASAKKKAARALLGDHARTRASMPDNAQIEHELRRYLATFVPGHASRLETLRELALTVMRRLSAFQPHLVGAVLNGTATEHSDIRLQLFADSPKDVELFLLDQGVEFEVADSGDDTDRLEVLHMIIQPARARGMPPRIGVVIEIHPTDAIRVAPRHRSDAPDLHPIEASGRANILSVERLMTEQSGTSK